MQQFLFLVGFHCYLLLGKTLETGRGLVDSILQVCILRHHFTKLGLLVSELGFFYLFSGTSYVNKN